MGKTMEIRLHDYELTLRLDDARKITIEKIPAPAPADATTAKSADAQGRREIAHPGSADPATPLSRRGLFSCAAHAAIEMKGAARAAIPLSGAATLDRRARRDASHPHRRRGTHRQMSYSQRGLLHGLHCRLRGSRSPQ